MRERVTYQGETITRKDFEDMTLAYNEVMALFETPEPKFKAGDLISYPRVGGGRVFLHVVGGNVEHREDQMRKQHGPDCGTAEGRLRRGMILATDGVNVKEIVESKARLILHSKSHLW